MISEYARIERVLVLYSSRAIPVPSTLLREIYCVQYASISVDFAGEVLEIRVSIVLLGVIGVGYLYLAAGGIDISTLAVIFIDYTDAGRMDDFSTD